MVDALVLGGGGAKGDFEVGAVRFLYDNHLIKPGLICGTSVGAINAIKLAEGEGKVLPSGSASGLLGLEAVWRSLRKNDDMYISADWINHLDEDIRGLVVGMLSSLLGGPGSGGSVPNLPNPNPIADPSNAARSILTGFIFNVVAAFVDANFLGKVKGFLDLFASTNPNPPQSLYTLRPIRQRLTGGALDLSLVASSGIHLKIAIASLKDSKVHYVNELGRFDDRSQADLIDAVMASAGIPAAFEPVAVGSEGMFVDGGVAEVLPIQPAIEANSDHIFVVAASPDDPFNADDFHKASLLKVASRAVDMVQNVNGEKTLAAARALGTKVTFIRPGINVHDAFTIDPGLIHMAMDYGFLSAFCATRPNAIEVSLRTTLLLEIFSLRRDIWQAEQVLLSPERSLIVRVSKFQGGGGPGGSIPTTVQVDEFSLDRLRQYLAAVEGIRGMKADLASRVGSWITSGGPAKTPYTPDFSVWWLNWDQHQSPARPDHYPHVLENTPWDGASWQQEPGLVLKPAHPPSP